MYAVCVTFTLKPGQTEAFLPLMIENARQSRALEVGCQQFDVCRAGDVVFLYEIYDDRAAFDLHLAAPHFKSFDAAVGAMVADKQVTTFDEVLR
ncbi:putative quinol monooxygenase [Cognatishimia sp. SS12]|uniref:putative quinol monooxygenase n=1 Tax=Cognatishimia sp. SS12 TaxID=2979465 RepID=UPI00232F0A58|nr:putative quinol monooxygenase [Cognatishimia sp. SS12]MDC0738270.1 putative quinol monooxygenase [Cognatishimia sp. SS12]